MLSESDWAGGRRERKQTVRRGLAKISTFAVDCPSTTSKPSGIGITHDALLQRTDTLNEV